jgi:polysaccharide biosynthesis transport protein
LIEPPLLPEKPSKPNRLAIILIGIVLGIGAGVGTAAMLEFSDQSIRSPEALSRLTSSLVLVTIPEIGGKEKSSFRKQESKG